MTTFDPTKPVQTRDGRKARILATDHNSDTYPIIAYLGGMDFSFYTSQGLLISGCQTDSDLINVPERTSTFMNVYEDGETYLHDNLAQARNACAGRDGGTIECVFENHKLVEVIHHG